jgi:hypothetical protein
VPETVGSWWIARRELEPGESPIAAWNANRFQGSRAVGGKLFLTQRRLLFTPHRIDTLLRGQPWEARLDEPATAGIEPRASGKKAGFGGGLRKRLRIRSAGGAEELFVVNKLDEVLARIQEAGVAGESPEPSEPSGPGP